MEDRIASIQLKGKNSFQSQVDQFLKMEPTTIILITFIFSVIGGVVAEFVYDRMVKAYRRFKDRQKIRLHEEGSKYPSENDWR